MRRIERLEKSGVLASYQAMINVTAIGYLVKAFINLEVEPEQKPAFYPYIKSCTNVVECSCVTGDYSMLIEAYFHTTQELDQFVNYLQKFGRTRTQIVFSTCVEHRGIPLSEDSTLQPPNSLKKSEKTILINKNSEPDNKINPTRLYFTNYYLEAFSFHVSKKAA